MKYILFCGNYKVFDGMLSTMISIFKRSVSKEPLTFFVFIMDVSHLKAVWKILQNPIIRKTA